MDKAYHNKGFGPAFLWVIFLFLVVPTIIMFSIDDGWAKFVEMRGINGDCWENAQPYEFEEDGHRFHGWECGICGEFLQSG